MKRFIHTLILCLSLGLPIAIPLLIFQGCGTNAPTKAAQGEQIVIHTVNDGMAEWRDYVNAGKAKQSQIDKVKAGYNIYYTAQLTLKAVIEKLIAHDPNTSVADLATANSAAQNAETALINLLNEVLLKK